MAAVKNASSLKALIDSHEVVTSTKLRRRLVERGHTDVNARQVIHRTFSRGTDIWRSEAIVLPGGQRLFAHRSFYGRREFYRQIGEILKTHRPGLSRCLGLLGTSGVLTKAHASRLLASPVQTGPKVPFPGYDADVQALRELGVGVYQEGTAFEYLLGAGWKPGGHTDELAAESLKSLRRESLLARILVERLRRQNLISWGGTELPNRERVLVDFNNQYFSAYGFSHLGPVRRQVDEEDGKSRFVPSPVLFDVQAGLCSEVHVHSFLQRAERATCRGKNRLSWLGVVAAREFVPAAWKLARSCGLMTVNFRQMFGDEALEAMARVERLLEAFQLDRPPEATDPLFLSFADSVSELKTNPIVVNLRSIGFELVAAKALAANGYHNVGLNLIVPYPPTSRDVDVHGNRGDEACLVECKAYHSKKLLPPEDVKKFFTETVPAFRTWWAQRNGNPPKACRAELWTTGKIGSEARRQFERVQVHGSVTKGILNSDQILAYLPGSIRERCSLLMKSIAMTDDTGAGEVEGPSLEESGLDGSGIAS